MTFEQYLISKKIDSSRFCDQEPEVWKTWKAEFEQMHPQSFTAQKLYLINPVRRKYPLPTTPAEAATTTPAGNVNPEAPAAKPAFKPVFKPKPKIS